MWNSLLQDPFFGPTSSALTFESIFLFIVFFAIVLWSLAWKALGLWYAARNKQRVWFMALVIFNTVGILEILYLLWFQRDRNKEGTKFLFPLFDEWRKEFGLDLKRRTAHHQTAE